MRRRTFSLLAGSTLLSGPNLAAAGSIDRQRVVRRHDVVLDKADPWAPLSLGNGAFAFTADVTGLQSFPGRYAGSIPLATQSEWAWHSFPEAAGYTLDDTMEAFDTGGRDVFYPTRQNIPAGQALRQSPHRLGLARIGFVFTGADGVPVEIDEIENVNQRLDLWNGTLSSRFLLRANPFDVSTWVHPSLHLICVRVQAPRLRPGLNASVRIEFPYGSTTHTGDPADWQSPARHRTTVLDYSRGKTIWRRDLDAQHYYARAQWTGAAAFRQTGPHEFLLPLDPGTFEISFLFTPEATSAALPPVSETAAAARAHWNRFWTSGGAIDLGNCADSRAGELERRIVLSQYLTALQSSGAMPPQETGLTFNSWYGKFHLEMHWWHAAHFPLWGRPAMLARSLPWYRRILPLAQATAKRQGYRGARWPKMVGPDGRDSPSSIGPLLIWQQPHTIHLLELLYRHRNERKLLEDYQTVVFETADFMADFARRGDGGSRFVLGPPLIPAQELHPPRTTFNPTFELAYWRYGLATAQKWRQRLGLDRVAHWDDVLVNLADYPQSDGVYVNAESDPVTFQDASKRRDHPTLLGAFGMLPGDRIDPETMRRTLLRVMKTWNWDETWGWDYPLTAMTAARVGEPGIAMDALLMNVPKNRYLPNGHNFQRSGLTIYLPGNGGLLAAVAMMAAGWDGAPQADAPGFPKDGKWNVRWEGLQSLP